ncbi:MAG TPA: ABC transporter substrate-binding protein [Methanospirillum sp.]|uniref:ABC transporter substrate-binding protein n=1 Tax=Methanospirillum sp. TaxID=45200 RepID=UPI002B98EED9|nr:ABC transporter substrate-binding protein [Methanospirillum sp.]HWQ63017.1 ABC transporter substrate-binding protein [Methanospirillum sp.]
MKKTGHVLLTGLFLVTLVFITAIPLAAGAESTLTVGLSEMKVKGYSGGLDAQAYNAPMPVYSQVYDALVEYGDGGEIKPGLAESWEVSSDGKVYTYHLRKGVQFSDGTPCDANAVKFSMERLQKKDSAAWMSMDDFSKIEVVDDNTVKIYYDKPSYSILQEMSLCRPQRIMSPNSVNPKGDPNGTFETPIGTGPFKFESYTDGKEYVLVRNDKYWGEKPKVDKIVFKLIPDENTRTMALKSGEVDILGSGLSTIEPSRVQDLESTSGISIEKRDGDMAIGLIPNYSKGPLADEKVREALNHAINTKSIASDLFEGIYTPGKGAFSTTIPYFKQAVESGVVSGYDYNPDKAKELLSVAGYEDTNNDGIREKGGSNLELNLIIPSLMPWSGYGVSDQRPLAETIQADLKNVGIKVNINSMEGGAWWDAVTKSHDYDMYIYGPWGVIYDPLITLKAYWYTGGRLQYSDPALDTMIDNAYASTDESSRQQILNNIFTYLQDHSLMIPIYQDEKIFATQSKVKGFEIPASDFIFNLKTVEVSS